MKSFVVLAISFFTLPLFSQIAFNPDEFSDLKYRNVGPTRGGRVTAVAGIESQPSTFFMGATGGGVWKTDDFGQSWQNVSDGYFSSPSIGAIRVSEANPDIIYVGTGSDGIRSNVIIGDGMYKSTDQGKTWKHIGLKKAGQIGAVLIHPDNPEICYVAAIGNPFGPNPERGVFKTTDGGESWEKVLFLSDKTGFCDLEFAPDNPDFIYASAWTVDRKPWTIISGSIEGGLYKTVDGGDSWMQLADGLPTGIVGKSDLAVCLAEPSFVYALIEAENGQNGLYLSTDYGEHFEKISDYAPLLDRPFYYCNVDAHPGNPDIIYVNSTGLHLSTDRGKSWRRQSTPHGDNHDMWINPSDPEIFIQSNDGGANVTRDGGKTWSTQDNQPTAELYQVDLDDQFPYHLYAGQQDNSTLAISSVLTVRPGREVMDFISVGGCETGPVVPKPGNHNIVYANCKGRFGVYNKLTGQEKQYYVGAGNMYGHNTADLKYRFQRVAPIYVSPHNPDVVYHCSQYVHKTTDDGVTWETISPDLTANEPDKQMISGGPITRDITGEEFYSTLYTITESPLKEGLIWVGANDGLVHVTADGGENWTNVTPSDCPAGGRVQTVEASAHAAGKAYVAILLYMLDDWEPRIYRTNDFGQSWTLLTNGENGMPPDCPTRVIREDPEREGLLYAGTDYGVFVSFNDGESWKPFQQNLPVVPVTDMKVKDGDLVLSTMGRGFWILDNMTPLRQIDGLQGGLFKVRDAYRSRVTGGVDLDYYLKKEAEEVRIEILDLDRKIMAVLEAEPEAGFHRTDWSLLYQPESARESGNKGRRSYGPAVVPGSYTVRLVVDGQEQETDLTVLADPRIVADGMTQRDFEEQFELCLQVMELREEANDMLREVDSLLKTEDLRPKTEIRTKSEELRLMKRLLETGSGVYPQPMLLSQIGYLYSMISRADQKPGDQAYLRYEELKKELEILKQKVKQVR